MRTHLTIRPDGTVDRAGIVTPPATKLVKRGAEYVVIKVPGHTYWAGRFMDRSYAAAEFEVYRTAAGTTIEATEFWAELLTSFPVRS